MFTTRRLFISILLLLGLLITALAQGEQSAKVGLNASPKSSQTSATVTASATAERVRFTSSDLTRGLRNSQSFFNRIRSLLYRCVPFRRRQSGGFERSE